jgi:hypothetical protein
MIAQVWTFKGPTGPISKEARKFVEEAHSQARTRDGVEGSLSILDPATGDTVDKPVPGPGFPGCIPGVREGKRSPRGKKLVAAT